MRTITLETPSCAFCKKTLVGEAELFDSGKMLHRQCVEEAAELGLRSALTLTKWEAPEPVSTPVAIPEGLRSAAGRGIS